MAQKETPLLLRSNLKALRLPTMLAEYGKLAGEATNSNQDYLDYLLRLTELELATRSANALQARIKQAGFPVQKDLDAFDFTRRPASRSPRSWNWPAAAGLISVRTAACWVVRELEKRIWPSPWAWPPADWASESASLPLPHWSIAWKRRRSSTSSSDC